MLHYLLSALLAIVFLPPSPSLAQPTDPRIYDAHTVRLMSMAVMTWAQDHDGTLPPDMSSMYDYIAGKPEGTVEERKATIRKAFLSSGDQGVKIPDEADPKWAADHSSFAYIGVEGLKIEGLGSWGDLAIVHQRLDKGTVVEASEQNPEGRVFSIAFIDGHAEMMGRAQAESVIADSIAVFRALKSGGTLPDSHQLDMDILAIRSAIVAYAKAHNDDLPPDLGATLPFLPAPKVQAKKPLPKAAAYLLPEAQRNTHIPEDADSDWVNAHTSYIYLGTAGAPLAKIEDPQDTILFHGRRPVELRKRGVPFKGIPLATVWGQTVIADDDYAKWMIDVSKRVVAFAKTGSPLPEHLNAYRDCRLITKAILDYAKAHKGQMPPDLGTTLAYLDPSLSTAEKALLYLSPRTESSTTLPDELTPDWINRRSNYVYLGAAGIDVKFAREAGVQYVLHGPLTETYEVLRPGVPAMPMVAVGSFWGTAWLEPPDSVGPHAVEFRQSLDAIKVGAGK